MIQELLFVFLPSFVGGFIQATIGFGSGIIMMIFFPMFLSVLEGGGLSCLISLFNNGQLAVHYRRKINYRQMLLPLVLFFIFNFIAVRLAVHLNVDSLKIYLGIFLTALAIYFLIFSDRIHIKGGPVSAVICSLLAGFSGGFFGIAGPPMVIYFLALSGDDKEGYIGTLQAFFFITGLYSTILRILSGILTWKIVPMLIAGGIGITIGGILGTKVLEKINARVMRICIYSFLAIAGILKIIGF